MINVVVITHGDFGAYLIEAAETIIGAQTEGIKNIAVSPKLPLEKIKSRIEDVIKEMQSKDGIVFLIDMPGGTPMNVVLPLVKDLPKSAVICGININMLLSAFNHRKNMDFESLIRKIIEDGKKAIVEVKSLLCR